MDSDFRYITQCRITSVTMTGIKNPRSTYHIFWATSLDDSQIGTKYENTQLWDYWTQVYIPGIQRKCHSIQCNWDLISSQYYKSILWIRHFILALKALTHTLKISFCHLSLSQHMSAHQSLLISSAHDLACWPLTERDVILSSVPTRHRSIKIARGPLNLTDKLAWKLSAQICSLLECEDSQVGATCP